MDKVRLTPSYSVWYIKPFIHYDNRLNEYLLKSTYVIKL